MRRAHVATLSATCPTATRSVGRHQLAQLASAALGLSSVDASMPSSTPLTATAAVVEEDQSQQPLTPPPQPQPPRPPISANSQSQRLLRRLPVGRTQRTFHLNELSHPVKGQVIAQLLEEHRRQQQQHNSNDSNGNNGNSKRRTRLKGNGDDDGDDATRNESDAAAHPLPLVVVLGSPVLRPSSTSLQSAFNVSDKAVRRLLHTRLLNDGLHHHNDDDNTPAGSVSVSHAGLLRSALRAFDPSVTTTNGGAAGSAADTDYDVALEEAVMLLPDTSAEYTSLSLVRPEIAGAATGTTATTATATAPPALMLRTESTAVRVDYHSTPNVYILGVPAALLAREDSVSSGNNGASMDGEHGDGNSCSRSSSSSGGAAAAGTTAIGRIVRRYIVHDPLSNELLLVRRRRRQPCPPHPTTSATTATEVAPPVAAAVPSSLEDGMFLWQSSAFNPTKAHAAATAAAAQKGPTSSSSGSGGGGGGYRLLYLTCSADWHQFQAHASAFPCSYRSSTVDVATTARLPALMERAALQRRQQRVRRGVGTGGMGPRWPATTTTTVVALPFRREGGESFAPLALWAPLRAKRLRVGTASPPTSDAPRGTASGGSLWSTPQAPDGEALSRFGAARDREPRDGGGRSDDGGNVAVEFMRALTRGFRMREVALCTTDQGTADDAAMDESSGGAGGDGDGDEDGDGSKRQGYASGSQPSAGGDALSQESTCGGGVASCPWHFSRGNAAHAALFARLFLSPPAQPPSLLSSPVSQRLWPTLSLRTAPTCVRILEPILPPPPPPSLSSVTGGAAPAATSLETAVMDALYHGRRLLPLRADGDGNGNGAHPALHPLANGDWLLPPAAADALVAVVEGALLPFLRQPLHDENNGESQSSNDNGGIDPLSSSSLSSCCDAHRAALWRSLAAASPDSRVRRIFALGELESLSGWRRRRHDRRHGCLAQALGSHIALFLGHSSSHGCSASGVSVEDGPLVFLRSAAFAGEVLLPLLRAFAAERYHVCPRTRLYRRSGRVGREGGDTARGEDVAVAVHHRRLLSLLPTEGGGGGGSTTTGGGSMVLPTGIAELVGLTAWECASRSRRRNCPKRSSYSPSFTSSSVPAGSNVPVPARETAVAAVPIAEFLMWAGEVAAALPVDGSITGDGTHTTTTVTHHSSTTLLPPPPPPSPRLSLSSDDVAKALGFFALFPRHFDVLLGDRTTVAFSNVVLKRKITRSV